MVWKQHMLTTDFAMSFQWQTKSVYHFTSTTKRSTTPIACKPPSFDVCRGLWRCGSTLVSHAKGIWIEALGVAKIFSIVQDAWFFRAGLLNKISSWPQTCIPQFFVADKTHSLLFLQWYLYVQWRNGALHGLTMSTKLESIWRQERTEALCLYE